jgi:hypothetical protein
MTKLADLLRVPRWCAWCNERRGNCLTKVPYSGPGQLAKANAPGTWQTHDTAAELVKTVVNGGDGGVGIFLGQCGDMWLSGIDLDTCRHSGTGDIDPWAQEVLDRLDTFAEVSPSQTGVKAYFLINPADLGAIRALMTTQHGRSWKRQNGKEHPPAIELHISNRYFAVTWDTLGDRAELRTVTFDDLRWLIEEAGPNFAGKPAEEKTKPRPEHQDGREPFGNILARLYTAAQHNRGIAAALLSASTLHGGSRSEGPFGLGAALKRAGWSFVDVRVALLACPATREWTADKQTSEGDRWAERIWDNVHTDHPIEQPCAEPGPRPVETKPDRGGKHGRLLVLGMSDIETAPLRDYLLRGVISPGEISVWVGPPKCGKSFLLLHVAYLLSLGHSVFGCRVKPTKVLYVAAEGEGGIAKRLRGLRDKHGPSGNFHLIAQPIDLLRDGGHKLEVIDAANAIGGQLIIIDTLNRALAGGDENRSDDMGAFICNIAEIRSKTGCHIAVVHHGTKASDGRSPRGHGSLEGADDALIEVQKLEGGIRTATLVHSKDDADGMRWGFKLDLVNLGTDDDGDAVTTLIVREELKAPEQAAGPAKPSQNEQIALACLDAAIDAEQTSTTVGDDHESRPAVFELAWRQRYYATAKPGETDKAKQQAFRRAVEGLLAKDLVGCQDGYVYRPGHA